MKFSERWLRTLANPPIDTEALARALTMAGLEVEAVEPVAPAMSGVVAARIVRADPHPNAERLRVCVVDAGPGNEALQIVCGAPNAAAGLVVPCSLVGATLPAGKIGKAKLRGVESSGMLCSEKDLGLAETSDGLLILPADTPIGRDIREVLELDDRALTLKLTPNRSDCLSLAGIAREVGAVCAVPVTLPATVAVPETLGATRAVSAADEQACPRYCGRVIELDRPTAPTPAWMVRRLQRSGLRAISALVDVTNYVMLELGQPLHAFDDAKLDGPIVVRYAKAGEKLLLLNGQAVDLEPDMLTITDVTGPVALAGVMGGDATAVTDATTRVFLESAFFAPAAIAGRARRLGLNSDAAYRFERGVDFALARAALDRATVLMLEICGGRAGPATEAVYALPARLPVDVRVARVERILGIAPGDQAVAEIWRRLGLEFIAKDGVHRIVPPSYRFDLAVEADFVEEVARLHGYDHIPEAIPGAALELRPASESVRSRDWFARALVDRDYQEVVTYSFVDPAWERDFAGNSSPVALANPMSAQMSVMRSSLAGSLIDCLRTNLNRRADRVRLFEIGRCFLRAEDGKYRQPERIAALAYGSRYPEQWAEPPRVVDFFDAKADLEALVPGGGLRLAPAPHPALHPGRSASVEVAGRSVGWIGELHPKLVQAYDLPSAPVLFEVDLESIRAAAVPKFTEVSRFPPVRRDIAVIVDESVPAQAMLDALEAAKADFVVEIALFDTYRGGKLGENRKSLAFRIVMQDTEETLTEQKIESARLALAGILTSRFGGELRQ
jgi:phenylalanyl-tRNA synthetase beta chain